MNGIASPGIVGLSTLDYLAVKSTDIQQQRDEPKNGSDSITSLSITAFWGTPLVTWNMFI